MIIYNATGRETRISEDGESIEIPGDVDLNLQWCEVCRKFFYIAVDKNDNLKRVRESLSIAEAFPYLSTELRLIILTRVHTDCGAQH